MFCSRCGTRLFAPKPAAIREYVLLKVRPSLWYCANFFIVGLLVKAFGAKVFDVIEAEPDRLREVTGIGPMRARRITEAWAEQKSANCCTAGSNAMGTCVCDYFSCDSTIMPLPPG